MIGKGGRTWGDNTVWLGRRRDEFKGLMFVKVWVFLSMARFDGVTPKWNPIYYFRRILGGMLFRLDDVYCYY